MFKRSCKPLALFVCLLFLGATIMEGAAYAQRSGSRRPGSSSSSSKPKYSSPSSSRPRPSSRPPSSSAGKTTGSKPKYSSPGSSSQQGKPKYTSPSSKPGTSGSRPSANSRRPSSSSSSSRERSARAATSQRKYQESKRATAPPKPSYTDSHGHTVKVRTQSSHVQTMRSKPSSYYTPAAREQRISVHVTNHYSHPYSYYHSQPYYHLGGGYSSAFWYMMGEWSAERRARWLYHNRNTIESAAYQKGVQDAQVAAQIRALESQGVARNADYVDSEFADNPDMMYSQGYVEAAYNPTVLSPSGATALTVLLWLMVIAVVGVAGYFFLTRVRFGR